MILFTFAVIGVLIAVNALYVAAEFAAVSVQRNRIRQMADSGNYLAKRLLPILQDTHKLDRYIAACQIGITVSSLVLGAYGQASLAKILIPLFERWGSMQEVAAQSSSALVVLIVLTTLQVVLGELVPKSLALQFPAQVALYTYLPMRWSLVLLTWFIAVLNGSGLLLLKLMGVPPAEGHRHIHSPEEIDMLLAESRDGGLLEPDEHQRLHRALQLGLRTAEQLMIPRLQVVTINAELSGEQLLEFIAKEPYTHFPVYKGSPDIIVGILHTKDLVLRYIQDNRVPSISDIMAPITFVPEKVTADRLLTTMREQHISQAMVIDEYGNIQGLITLEDLLTEMLGEIGDEFKKRQVQPERLPGGRVRLPGLMRLHEAEQWLNIRWQGNANTVAGRIVQALERLPAGGERLIIEGVQVEVEGVMNHAIVSVVATPLPVHGSADDKDAK